MARARLARSPFCCFSSARQWLHDERVIARQSSEFAPETEGMDTVGVKKKTLLGGVWWALLWVVGSSLSSLGPWRGGLPSFLGGGVLSLRFLGKGKCNSTGRNKSSPFLWVVACLAFSPLDRM